MSKSKKGQLTYEGRMKHFEKFPCLATARQVFIACRHHDIPTPDKVLDIIYTQLKKDDEEWRAKALQHSNKISERRAPKEKILSCALRTKTLEDAYKLYKEETGEHTVFNTALRRRLERHLHEELISLIETEITKDYRQYFLSQIPKKLKDKLLFYKELKANIY